jgi:hypothetical protein
VGTICNEKRRQRNKILCPEISILWPVEVKKYGQNENIEYDDYLIQ